MAEVVIVGNGPAGISAALYAARGGVKATVIGKDGGALEKAEEIENYYGFPDVVSGRQLIQNGLAQAKRLGVRLVQDEVVNIGFEERLTVAATGGAYGADAVILATGTARRRPTIKGLAEYEGKGVSYCAVCDAFFYRGKDVAVLGNGEFALHEANVLAPVVKSVTIVTHGAPAPAGTPEEFRVIETPMTEFAGDGLLDTIHFEDGTTLEVPGVFIAIGVAGSAALARKIGAATEGEQIVVDKNMATNIPGLYAAGDCTGGLLQVAKAVYEGAVAGVQAVKYLHGKHQAP